MKKIRIRMNICSKLCKGRIDINNLRSENSIMVCIYVYILVK